ncbi:MAG: HlyC/CorC family transporter [Clostridia bacterium]|nr:HlyC/CorC family transporter [Clostridia bacterium]
MLQVDSSTLLQNLSQNAGTIIALILLLLFSAYFSSSETAITAISRVRIKAMADNGDKKAKTALKLVKNFEKTLTTVLVGNNIVNIAMGSLSTLLAIHLGFEPLIVTIVVTLAVLIFGEVTPKAIIKNLGERYTLAVAPSLSFFSLILTPFSALFALLSRLLTKLFAKKDAPSVTEDDVIDMIEDMEEDGAIDSDESRLLYSAFEFGDVSVNDIFTDRRDMVCLDIASTPDEILSFVKDASYSRIPVYKGDVDNIVGILLVREYLEAHLCGQKPTLRKLLHTPYFTSPDAKIDEVLSAMKKLKKPLAIVKTRAGRTIGLVTMEDMVEELVGEIWDENDRIEEKFRKLDDTTFEINADLSVVSAFEMMDFEDFDRDECGHYTLRKWVGRRLGRVPTVNTKLAYRNLDITVNKVFKGRLLWLTFKINPPIEEEDDK